MKVIKMHQLKPTRRAYTMRLTGANREDKSWSTALWETHLAVNKGTQIFGDWLLTFRGGIPASVAADNSLPGTLAHRRSILALSWISVEDEEGAPKKYQVSKDQTIETLKAILKEQGILEKEEIQEWIKDCAGSLEASIRTGATWVNRFQCFKARQQEVNINTEDIEDFLIHFFGNWKAYFELPTKEKNKQEQDEEEDTKKGKKPSNKDSTKDLIIKAGHWLSGRFGSGQGANYEQFTRVYNIILDWLSTDMPLNISGIEIISSLITYLNINQIPAKGIEDILNHLSGPGYKSGTKFLLQQIHQQERSSKDTLVSLEEKVKNDQNNAKLKIGKKGIRPYSQFMLTKIEAEVGFPYNPEDAASNHQEYSVMLDQAARRVSQTHSWVKRAEASRNAFEEDISKIENVSKQAVNWLDQYRVDRAQKAGNNEEYIIRKSAISAWEKVLKKWQSCQDEESRIKAVKILQDDDTIKKFGDINFFIALASEKARCVWEENGKTKSEILKNYVDSIVAQHDQQRFKVPAYRHPDPLKHPVFVEFGNSRWSVRYESHQTVLAPDKKKKLKSQEGFDSQKITLTLWDGNVLHPISMRWQGKRFSKEVLGSNFDPTLANSQALIGVSRQARFGKATTEIDESNQILRTLQVFSEKDWNARLQVNRKMLEKLERLQRKYGIEDHRVQNSIKNLPWFISHSANLQPTGVWEQYINNADKLSQQAFMRDKKVISYTGWPHQLVNEHRGKSNRLTLCRLPNLRVLGVDLGIRYGASCTVWETLSTKEIKNYCNEYNVPYPQEDDLYYVIPTPTNRKLFFRRIAGDKLLDGNLHPSPWARLERQFFIKLQGEEKPSRKPSPDEYQWYKDLEKQLGRSSDEEKCLHISELHRKAISIVKKASKHHNQIAIIAHNIAKPVRILPGGRTEELLADKQSIWIEQVAEALIDLWNLNNPKQPYYQEIKCLWENNIKPLLPDDLKNEFSNEKLIHANEEEVTRKTQKAKSTKQIEKLKPIGAYLITNDSERLALVNVLEYFWKTFDNTHFYPILKELRNHILPQGGKNRKSDGSIRKVGGLSQERIINITELRRINDAFSKRPTPDDLQVNISTKGELRKAHFSEENALITIERLRENRCKQLSSRIVEAALGLGAVKSQAGKRLERPTYDPCHAIIIENLEHYRPDELRTRRENRNLMNWSSKQIQKYLSDNCELYGIHLRTVSPSYTSRQDYRTGVGGLRCNDYDPWTLINSPWFKKKIEKAQKSNKKTPIEEWLLELWSCWNEQEQIWTDFNKQQWQRNNDKWTLLISKSSNKGQPNPIRIPERGGEIFISAAKDAGKGIHADLNAAANIGLKALLDPDWRGAHWKLTVNTLTGQPEILKNEDSLLSHDIKNSLLELNTSEFTPSHSKKKDSEKMNLFCNPSINGLTDNSRQWKSYKDYYEWVEYSVIEHLKRHRVQH